MEDAKLLSIIVPVHNCEHYLRPCLESLSRQSFYEQDYEIIIINDGSTDKSEDVILQYCNKYSYLKLISMKNAGVSSARNIGIQFANSKYVAFVDADDYVQDNIYIPIMHGVVKDNLGAFYFSYTQNECEILGGGKNRWKLEYDICYHKCAVDVWRVIYERELLIENNLFFEPNIMMGEDYLFNVFYTCACKKDRKKVGFSTQKLYYYRPNPNSICNKLNSEKRTKEKTVLQRSFDSKLLSAVRIKMSPYYQDKNNELFLQGAISENLLSCLWLGMIAENNPRTVWESISNNDFSPQKDITVKNIEGHSFRLRLKSKIQYLFRYYPVYSISCYLYRALMKISNCFRK